MIPYLGDKSKISDFLKQYLPNSFDRWVEPFGGGFNLYFTLDISKYPDTQFYYNDINSLNFNLFENLKSQEFIDLVKSTYVTKEIFDKNYLKLRSKSKSKKSDINRALAWLIMLCCGESKEPMSGEYKGNSAFEILKYKLPKYSEYFSRIEVSNYDYLECIKKYDSDTTFFYLDPPYRKKEHFYINHNFTDASHLELSKILKDIKGKFALSYYHFPEIDEWYSEYNIIEHKTLIGTEILIMNY
jgi:DNA adenine methylase